MKKLFELKNGLRVYFHHIKSQFSVNILVNIECGAFYPQNQKTGIAHMLEHNIFYEPDGEKTLDEKLGEIGTFVEANTYDFNTVYSIHTFKDHTKKCIELLMNKVFNASFDEGFFKNEKKVIFQEYLKHRNEIMPANAFLASEKFYAGSMIENSGYGIGTKKQIDVIEFNDMLNFYNMFYNMKNASIVIVGNFDQQEALNIIKKISYKIDNSKNDHKKFVLESLLFDDTASIEMVNKQKNLMSSCSELIFSATNEMQQNKWAYDVLANMLCGLSTSSLLKKRLRKELAIIYNCDAATDKLICYNNCGTISVRYFVKNSKVEQSIVETIKCLAGVLSNKFVDIFEYSKQCVINNLIIKCENIEKLSLFHAFGLMYEHKGFNLKETVEYISRIKYSDIIDCIKHMLSHRICVAVTGEKIDTKVLKRTLKSYVVY